MKSARLGVKNSSVLAMDHKLDSHTPLRGRVDRLFSQPSSIAAESIQVFPSLVVATLLEPPL